MAQKVNPNIFRLGVSKSWDSRYSELNHEEHTLYNYQNIEIKSHVKESFKSLGLSVHSTKLSYGQKYIHILISYYYTEKFSTLIKKTPNTFKLEKCRPRTLVKKVTNGRVVGGKLSDFLTKNAKTPNHNRRDFRFRNRKNNVLKSKRLGIISQYKKLDSKRKFLNESILKKNGLLNGLLETLTSFTGAKYHIKLVLQHANKGLTTNLNQLEKKQLKQKTLLLRQYSRQKFFKEGLSTIITLLCVKGSANLLANFLAKQLKGLKRHNHFLIFLKRTLNYLIVLRFSNVKGVKVIVSGRVNGAPRARSKIIVAGDVPTHSLDRDIDYVQETAFTKNGTFGIKIWVN